MAIPVADIDMRLSAILNDEDHIRWPLDERLAWINDAAAEIVLVRPAAGARVETIDLVAGVYQTIPADGLQLLDVVRNIRADDLPGRPISRTDRRLLDEQEPSWYEKEPAGAVKHYTFDDRDPRGFYVYPPVTAGVKVEALYAAPPAPVTALEDTLDLDRAYIGPVVSYVLYRTLAKDSEYANGAVAAAHLQAFNAAIGARNEIAIATGPKGALNETA